MLSVADTVGKVGLLTPKKGMTALGAYDFNTESSWEIR